MSGKIIKFSRNTENAPISSVSTQTVAFSHYNNISAQLPVDPKTGEIVASNVNGQAKQCLANIQVIAESIGHVMDDVVKINIFLKNISDIEAVDAVYATFFQSYFPTRTIVEVAALPMYGALVQMDAVISNGEGTPSSESTPAQELGDLMYGSNYYGRNYHGSNYQVGNFMHEMAFHYQARSIKRNQIGKVVARNTENSPRKFAKNPKPYPTKVARNTENAPKSSISTHTVAFSHYNNISAQLPIDPKSGKLVAGGVKEQAGQCLKNIKGNFRKYRRSF